MKNKLSVALNCALFFTLIVAMTLGNLLVNDPNFYRMRDATMLPILNLSPLAIANLVLLLGSMFVWPFALAVTFAHWKSRFIRDAALSCALGCGVNWVYYYLSAARVFG